MKPFDIKTPLYTHQQKAFDKLFKIKVGGLFMEMGTGKTRTAIEFIKQRTKKIDRVVWCCPVSIKETIKQEILKHTYTNENQIYLFNDKTTDKNIPTTANWIIIGIESVGQSDRVTLALNSVVGKDTMLVIDESSFIKGHRSKRTQRLTLIGDRARYRLLLTGTPISQGIVDLYAQMKFLSYKILNYRSFHTFAVNHLVFDERYRGRIVKTLNEDYIAHKIAPYIYQVKKDECLDLPNKIYDSRYFKMSCEQREDYEAMKEQLIVSILEDDVNIGDIFRLLLRLQQITSGFLFEKKYNSLREDLLKEIIEDIPPAKKIVIWAKFKRDIESICEAVKPFGKYSVFTGSTPQSKRQNIINDFQNADTRFFIANTAAGGFGINLTQASYAIFYNNSFKYAERLQAEDRCHRIGQTKRVTYIDILCSDSIDSKIYDILFRKENIVEAFKREVEKIKEKQFDAKNINKYLGI